MAGEMNSRNWDDQWRQEGKGRDDGREFPPEDGEKTPEQQEKEQRQQENKENKDKDTKPDATTYPTLE